MDKNSSLAIIEKVGIGTIDHMTHIDNLGSIFENGLLAHNNPYKEIDISNKKVNDRRNTEEPIYNRNLHDYVPLYFNPRNAMLYKTQMEFGDEIIILGFKSDTILLENSLFTNGNAASNHTLYSNDIRELEHEDWNWDRIWSSSWHGQPDEKNIMWSMMAEVLIYKKIELNQLQEIYCSSYYMKRYIKRHYALINIDVNVNRQIFF